MQGYLKVQTHLSQKKFLFMLVFSPLSLFAFFLPLFHKYLNVRCGLMNWARERPDNITVTDSVLMFLSVCPGALISDNLAEVRELTIEATPRWKELGLQLKLKPTSLDIIAMDAHDTHDRFREMIRDWLRMADPPPTWEALIAALKSQSVGLRDLARKVERACGVKTSDDLPEATPSAG